MKLVAQEGEDLKLTEEQIPAVGSKPDAGYVAGIWDTAPDNAVLITENTIYTYTYAKQDTTTFGTSNFILLEGVGTIEANAFNEVTKMSVVDARNCTKIDAEAFKGTGVKQILLDKDCEIDENGFSGCGTAYVFAPDGGKTKTFCDTHEGIEFVAVE